MHYLKLIDEYLLLLLLKKKAFTAFESNFTL